MAIKIALLAFGLAAATLAPALAQEFPNRPITIISAQASGGASDTVGRAVMDRLQLALGQPIVLENRPGAGGNVGAAAVARAAPDGTTLMIGTDAMMTSNVHLYKSMGFDPVKDFAPITNAGANIIVMAVNADVQAKSVAELVAYAKANPGKLAFGFGLATMPHIIGETFKQAAAIDIIDVPYRGGEQARADLLGGRVHINIAPVPQLLQLIRDGKIRALAYTGPRRHPELPEVPTMRESGYPQVGFDPDVWMGILAPAGTPQAIVDKLNRDVNATLKSDEMAPALQRFGYDAMITTPAEFETFFAAELRKWPPILTATGLSPQ
jgi:tripartite-type tricarboxylate transporter receptor subunit TctC